MKKLIAFCLTLAMVLCLLAGCGKKAAQTETSNSGGSSGSTSGDPVYIDADAANMTGTVHMYTAFAGENGTDALIQEFNKYYPNIKVEYEVYKNSADGNVGLDTSLMAGNADVLISYGVKNAANRWENGMLMDLTDRLAADNLDLTKEWGTDVYQYNDRVYAFPSGGLSVYIAINLDKWEAAGLGDIPTSWTWDEYLDACRKLTEKDASGNTTVYGGSDFNQTDYWTYAIRQSKGSNVFYKADGSADFDNSLWTTVLQREVDAEKEGIWYSKASYLADSTKSRDMFLNGTNATTVESILTRYIVAGKPQFHIAYAPYPVNAAGETNYMGGSIANSFVSVAKNAQDPDAAYAFAKFWATYGNKYMFAAGHACTWTGVDSTDILNVVFGSTEEAEKYIDTESFTKYVIATGEPAYSEDNISAFADIQSMIEEYTRYVLNGDMTASSAMAELQTNAQAAIEEAK